MKRSDLYSGIVVMAYSLLLFGFSFGIHEDVVPGDRLGSRFFPRLVVILLAVCAAFIIGDGLKAGRPAASGAPARPERSGGTPQRAAWTVCLSFGYIIFFKSLGIIVVTPLLIVGLMLAWGVKSKVNLVLIPVLSTAILYLLFGYAFEIMLPMGPLG